VGMDERRRSERVPCAIPARLLLAGGREAAATIRNIGELGALLSTQDLEVEIHEGERALLEHPKVTDGRATGTKKFRTSGAVVRVELDMDPAAILRHVAIYFDGGPKPVGVAP
jgi:hypothetical protein